MKRLAKVRSLVNRDSREMLKKGTSYRKETAAYSSQLLNNLLHSEQPLELPRKEFANFVQSKLKVDPERARDVANYIQVHLKSVEDEERLSHFYKRAEELLYRNGDGYKRKL
jgi:hypothetical protein